MVSIQGVSYGYESRKKILKDINLEIKQGECILLCGESGCGKTTMTKLVNGLIPHFCEQCELEGTVRIQDMEVASTKLYKIAESVGSVFQNPKSQFFQLDTDSEIAFGMENQGKSKEEMQSRLQNTVHNLHLEKLLGRNIFELSGGEKQLLAFASVYAMNPSVYVLDEPTANLDFSAIQSIKQLLRILKQNGHTIIIAEHRLSFLYDLLDRAVYLKNGILIKVYSKEEFLALSEQDRKRMGLRCLKEEEGELPKAHGAGKDIGLSIEALTVGYKKKCVLFNNISFSAIQGEILAITGYNGIGKTTLIRCVCGLMKQMGGQILLDGKIMPEKVRRQQCILVMQDVNHQLFAESVWEECKISGDGLEDSVIKSELKQMGLLSYADRHPMALSGGQKQRLAIVTAILSCKKILIFDEPTSGLDYATMIMVSTRLKKLAKSGRIVIVVTHDKEFMLSACDRVLKI
ncbi:monosaccharide ABC transporter ATP-binding protein (CUT2 family) [Lachnotalea glycerini]|uniref:Monosaccharide ABC transporter ATP-binding protein (CUT2 family) n=1 Tax=Lachnotalea glycerini TaxID=1763509 RepID=A0A318ETQ1_9FIRM|nr:ABC transporter ATP-binding protein [Lachnotalea glycerini]PXV95890.1 monosaccharide ABC transporter ATP-binding protein (CUT2 family) [Lachnotalea glycerini]